MNNIFKKGNIPWNKGLTAKTDSRISAGWSCSEEDKRKRSEVNKGQIPWNKGLKKETDERVARNANAISKSAKKSYATWRKGWNTGLTKENNESMRKISDANKGKHRSKETCQKISKAQRGRPKPHSGVPRSDACKEKIRRARLKQKFFQRNTSIEIALQKELDRRCISYQTHIPICGVCQPDIVFPELKVAVFADGDYWHSKDFDNGKRWKKDRKQDLILKKNGWKPLRFWEHEIKSSVQTCVDQIKSCILTRINQGVLEGVAFE